jgi:hypothetical protein
MEQKVVPTDIAGLVERLENPLRQFTDGQLSDTGTVLVMTEAATALTALSARVAELEAENFQLAAGQCIVHGGLVGDEGGSPYCTLIKRAEQAERELAAAREALRNVQGIISEAASTGFVWSDWDWAERLFASQQVTSKALAQKDGGNG